MAFNPMMGAAGGLGAGFLGDMFGGKNPADAASPYLNQIGGTLSPYFSPFINAGQGVINPLIGQYSQLMSNPQGLMKSIGEGYQKSPGYDFQMNQGLNAANQSAAAGGMAGTPMAQQNATQFASQFANQDFNQYLQQALGLYGMGLQGTQGMMDTGAKASMGYGEDLATALMAQAQLAYAGQNAQNQQQQGMFGNLIGGGLSLLGSFL